MARLPALPRLERRSALAQVVLIGFICFCCPGIYNAVTAMAGGIDDAEVNNAANAWLYSCFASFSLVAPAVCNQLGPRLTLFVGTLGYAVFVAALLLFREGAGEYVVIGAVSSSKRQHPSVHT